jgi:hypothetical protein
LLMHFFNMVPVWMQLTQPLVLLLLPLHSVTPWTR